jgi:hypothetical protein
MGLEISNNCIFDFTLGLQDGIQVIHQQLLKKCVLQPDVALEAPVIENIPFKQTVQIPCLAFTVKQITGCRAMQATAEAQHSSA